MEEAKNVVTHHFIKDSGHEVEEIIDKIRSDVGAVRRCYADGDGFSDDDFAHMMLLDGCFLLQCVRYMQLDAGAPGGKATRSRRSRDPESLGAMPSDMNHDLWNQSIVKDMMLLENQIPWMVLETLLGFTTHTTVDDVLEFVVMIMKRLFPSISNKHNGDEYGILLVDNLASKLADMARHKHKHKPPHLFALFCLTIMAPADSYRRSSPQPAMSTSAVELAQLGICLTRSSEGWPCHARINRCCPLFFAKLSVTPALLDDLAASFFVNAAAYQECSPPDRVGDCLGRVSSYVSLLAMLMDREEDVHQLRANRMLHSHFSNDETLRFFKQLGQRVRFAGCKDYSRILQDIEGYRRRRHYRVRLYAFLYNHKKFIVAFVSIASVLVGIFKTILSLKKGTY